MPNRRDSPNQLLMPGNEIFEIIKAKTIDASATRLVSIINRENKLLFELPTTLLIPTSLERLSTNAVAKFIKLKQAVASKKNANYHQSDKTFF